ncbi:PEGA domain-containing protein [Myxococcaceae bacterium GXIMD 01537]
MRLSRSWVLLAGLLGCARKQDELDSVVRARELMRSAETPRGDLSLKCEPADAEVYLDGVIQGLCTDFGGSPVGLRVGQGLHRVEVKKEGFWPYTTYFEPSGARATLRIQLRARGSSGGGSP